MPTLRQVVLPVDGRRPPPPSDAASITSAETFTPRPPDNITATAAAVPDAALSNQDMASTSSAVVPPAAAGGAAPAAAEAQQKKGTSPSNSSPDHVSAEAGGSQSKVSKANPALAAFGPSRQLQDKLREYVLEVEKRSKVKNIDGVPPADLQKSSQMEPTLLADPPHDEHNMTPNLILIRKHVEFFAASDEDVKGRLKRGGKAQHIIPGSIGMRCIHCSHLPLFERPSGSTTFPSKIDAVYQAGRNWIRYHLNVCSFIPEEIKNEYKSLKRSHSLKGAPKHWADSCRRKGLYDGYSDSHDATAIFYGSAKANEMNRNENKKRKMIPENVDRGNNRTDIVDLEPSDKKRKTLPVNVGGTNSPSVREPVEAKPSELSVQHQAPEKRQIPMNSESMQQQPFMRRNISMHRQLPLNRQLPTRRQLEMNQEVQVLLKQTISAEEDKSGDNPPAEQDATPNHMPPPSSRHEAKALAVPLFDSSVHVSVASAPDDLEDPRVPIPPKGAPLRDALSNILTLQAGQGTLNSTQQAHQNAIEPMHVAPLIDANRLSSLPSNVLLEIMLRSANNNTCGMPGVNFSDSSKQSTQEVDRASINANISSLLQKLPTEMLLRLADGDSVTATGIDVAKDAATDTDTDTATATATTVAGTGGRSQMTVVSTESEAKSQMAVEGPDPINKLSVMEDMQPLPAFPIGRLCSDSSNDLASHDNFRHEDMRKGSLENSMMETKPAGREISPRDRIRQIDNDIVKLLLGRQNIKS